MRQLGNFLENVVLQGICRIYCTTVQSCPQWQHYCTIWSLIRLQFLASFLDGKSNTFSCGSLTCHKECTIKYFSLLLQNQFTVSDAFFVLPLLMCQKQTWPSLCFHCLWSYKICVVLNGALHVLLHPKDPQKLAPSLSFGRRPNFSLISLPCDFCSMNVSSQCKQTSPDS